MDFQILLERYADLLVSHGLNVQPGQIVNIGAEAIHRELAFKVAEKAYEKGARFVSVDLIDPRLEILRLKYSNEENLSHVPAAVPAKYKELVETCGANLRILGSEDPDLYENVNPKKLNSLRKSQRSALKFFYEEGIGKSKVQWSLAAAATPAWAKKLFPELSAEEGCAKLWNAIFKVCRVDREDYLAQWKEHNLTLQKRAAWLTDLKIKTLHFTGPGTDLIVGLSSKAKFKGGTDDSSRGVPYEPNLPTEECFTTPDWRMTEGRVKTTRPFEIHGKMIKDLEVEFREGKIVSFKASQGEETFKEYIATDEGACRLGEVALVGIDSPIYQLGFNFDEILFDENAACHIAIGSSYTFCIDGGSDMQREELDAIGANDSHVHTDMMISSEQVNVEATTYSGEKVLLIKNGMWV